MPSPVSTMEKLNSLEILANRVLAMSSLQLGEDRDSFQKSHCKSQILTFICFLFFAVLSYPAFGLSYKWHCWPKPMHVQLLVDIYRKCKRYMLRGYDILKVGRLSRGSCKTRQCLNNYVSFLFCVSTSRRQCELWRGLFKIQAVIESELSVVDSWLRHCGVFMLLVFNHLCWRAVVVCNAISTETLNSWRCAFKS